MTKENWKDIEGYEGIYQVSDRGRVKSLNYNHTGKEKILKTRKVKERYLHVCLWKDGEYKFCFVHRLVAQAFIPNPKNYPIINHKDENPSNNCVGNLEWCSSEYNNNYGTKIERFIKLPYEQKKQMGQNARKKVEKEFDRQIVIDAYLNEIERINKA